MKKVLLLCLLLLNAGVMLSKDQEMKENVAQPSGISKECEAKMLEIVEADSADVKASFKGGMNNLINWLGKNIKYPPRPMQAGIQGKVVVKFHISKTGAISNPVILQSVDVDLDKEALRIMSIMPDWEPRNTRVCL